MIDYLEGRDRDDEDDDDDQIEKVPPASLRLFNASLTNLWQAIDVGKSR